MIRLGTRGSALAVAQSTTVADAIRTRTGHDVELVEIVTTGDRSSAPIPQLGVGVFVTALREALAAKDVDVAVHSYKDLPTAPADGLIVAAVPTRNDPRDALVARHGLTLSELPEGARIGTGALRRVAQLHALGRHLVPVPVLSGQLVLIGEVDDIQPAQLLPFEHPEVQEQLVTAEREARLHPDQPIMTALDAELASRFPTTSN